eukprot:CAMPEP_0201732180 /NCGR_PEP_ID=MMETSP0593-20130828/28125_1 /ASSEMBLY_ACC=CAM_ASM_000672 /TAXON_ID=267983 /ORGANISM="Skeletonema japonicum, Strain CCMP2506" /LENGTH=66 /DNA_ID=CAMNT_0048225105 /DNA_START=170 /DNA_END=366 /DNA_ORIENTATION=+
MTLIAANVMANAVMNVVYEVIDKDNRIAQNASNELPPLLVDELQEENAQLKVDMEELKRENKELKL